MSKLLTTEEVAGFLRLKVKTVYNMVSQGRIPYLKIGGRLRFDEGAIQTWMKQFALGETDPRWT